MLLFLSGNHSLVSISSLEQTLRFSWYLYAKKKLFTISVFCLEHNIAEKCIATSITLAKICVVLMCLHKIISMEIQMHFFVGPIVTFQTWSNIAIIDVVE